MPDPWRRRLFALLTIIVLTSLIASRQVSDTFWTEWLLSAGWIGFLVVLSVIYRNRAGKPIFPKLPANPLYGEGRASGGMASRCLIVAVTDDALIITPRFPFNLMFLPEVWGMEYEIPIAKLGEVRPKRGVFGSNVQILDRESHRSLGLRLLDPEAFAEAVARAQAALQR